MLTEPGRRGIGPAGAEARIGRAVHVLTADRSEILTWPPGTWRRIGGPAQTLAVWEE